MSSDHNGLCLTTSNTSSLTSNSSSLSTVKSNISIKFKNVLNRKRSQSYILPESTPFEPGLNLKTSTTRNKSLGSIQYSPTSSTIASFENLQLNTRSNSTTSISDTESTNLERPITPVTQLFKIEEYDDGNGNGNGNLSSHGQYQSFESPEKSPQKCITRVKIEENEEIFDNIADDILETIHRGESNVEWRI